MNPITRPEGSKRPHTSQASGPTFLTILGVPTFGLALSITMVSTYLPKVARQFTTSTTVIGVIVGAEGLMALWIPLVAGSWSDGVRSRLGGRLPFVLAGVPVVVGGLVLMAFVQSLVALGLAAAVFFVGYFVAYGPYRALYPDLVDEQVTGQAQSIQALWRGAGTGIALVGGGVLLSLGRAVPFLFAAVVLLLLVAAFATLLVRGGRFGPGPGPAHGIRRTVGELRRMLGDDPRLRSFLIANALWEMSLAALKTFVVLYITEGLGHSLSTASLIIGAAAVFVLISAGLSGKLADRFGKPRVMFVSLLVYGPGLLLPLISRTPILLAVILPVVAMGGGVVMTLPYAVLIPLMPDREHGALTGFFSLTRGLGTLLGPLVAGVAIQVLHGPFSSTHGYQAMWLVCSAAIFASIPFSRHLLREPIP
ncbi:MAG: MFS transporter [Solirubrobacteraceae bacterium]